jgi:hypothetical protein
MKRRIVAAATALVGLTATVGTAHAITNDYEDDHGNQFVGLMVAVDEDGAFMWRCSGALLDDRQTFLTAGHCTDQDFPDVDEEGEPFENSVAMVRIYFQQDAGANYDPDLEADPESGYPDTCEPVDESGVAQPNPNCVESTHVYDYGFDDFAGFPDTGDVGVVVLDDPFVIDDDEDDDYGHLAQPGVLDQLRNAHKANTLFEASGFGLSYSSPVGAESFRERLHGYGKFTNLNSANNDGYNLQTNGNGKDKGGTCSGDSGGPIFYPADTNNIVAVTSFGMNSWCRGVDFSYRVDRTDIQAWINSPTDRD